MSDTTDTATDTVSDTQRSVVHDTFSLERTYPAAPARVFAAWSTIAAKSQWFVTEEGLDVTEHTLDFRPGGTERLSATYRGTRFDVDSAYYDIVDGERIVWAYTMHMDDRRLSVSVATVQLVPVPGGTRLVLTEQGAYLDGLDTSAQRAQGTEVFLDALGDYLRATA